MLFEKKSKKGEEAMEKKVAIIGNTKLASLEPAQREFLEQLAKDFPDTGHGLPAYLRLADDRFAFIGDYKLPQKGFKKLEQEGPAGLYRGGSIIKVTSRYGVLVVPDERYQFFKPFAGMARYEEGHDLRLTGTRECLEEAFVYSLDKKQRFVPAGRTDAIKVCTLDFEVAEIVEVGEFIHLAYDINEKNRALEAVLSWDITDIAVPFSVSLEEKWFSGGRNGVSVFVIDPKTREVVGLFSGQQGFQQIPEYGIHEVLARYL